MSLIGASDEIAVIADVGPNGTGEPMTSTTSP